MGHVSSFFRYVKLPESMHPSFLQWWHGAQELWLFSDYQHANWLCWMCVMWFLPNAINHPQDNHQWVGFQPSKNGRFIHWVYHSCLEVSRTVEDPQKGALGIPSGWWYSPIHWRVWARDYESTGHSYWCVLRREVSGMIQSITFVMPSSQQPPATHPATLRLAPVRRKQWIHMNPQYCLVSPWQSPCLTPNAPPWHFRSPGCKMPVAGTRSKTDCSG